MNQYEKQETLADIAYDMGYARVRISPDSREKISTFIKWAEEFNKIHSNTDWSEADYLTEISNFIAEKQSEYLIHLDSTCPNCDQKSVHYEKIDCHGEDEYRVICLECGLTKEYGAAQKFIRESLFREYFWILIRHIQNELLIRQYLNDTLKIEDGRISADDLICHFDRWEEKNNDRFKGGRDKYPEILRKITEAEYDQIRGRIEKSGITIESAQGVYCGGTIEISDEHKCYPWFRCGNIEFYVTETGANQIM